MYFDIATRLDTTRLERRLACSVSPAAVVLEPLHESLCETLHESLHGPVPIGLASLLVAAASLLKAVRLSMNPSVSLSMSLSTGLYP